MPTHSLDSGCWHAGCKLSQLKRSRGSTWGLDYIERRITSAVRAYEHCLTLPHNEETELAARNNLAQDLLLLGRCQEGWKHYAKRFNRKPGNHPLFQSAFGPSHRGPLKPGRPLLLMSEQGFGDTLQFSRYALHLQHQGFDVTVLSQPALVPLLREGIGLKNVIDQLDIREWNKQQPNWLPLLDLLPTLRSQELWAPFSNGYLQVEAERVQRWATLLRRRPGQRLIALHWQGNPKHEHTLYSRGRSIPFERLLPLGQLVDVEFVSIQKGAGSEQCQNCKGLNFIAGQETVSESMDFRDTAAVLANCDLLISSDSAVVHLAGAMGIRTWLGLRWIPEWRWGLEGSSTTWYESVQLFRQPDDGNWDAVIDSMIAAWMQSITH